MRLLQDKTRGIVCLHAISAYIVIYSWPIFIFIVPH